MRSNLVWELKKLIWHFMVTFWGSMQQQGKGRRGVRKEQQNELCDLNHLACFDSDRILFTSFRPNPVYSRWPLLLLLVLASASPQVQTPDENVSALKPDVAKIRANVSVSIIRRVLPPAPIRQKIPVNSTLPEFSNTEKLPWVRWNGSIPNGAVSIYNKYTDRIDYICKVGCRSGFYNPSMGSYCHYPNKKEEHLSSSFQILVNEDNFEILEWKEDSYGSVPQNAVRTCSSEEMYVGKNKYGLGKVDLKDKCFYLPWEGREIWYQRSYEVLTHMMVEKDLISDVNYLTNEAKILKDPPKTLQSSTTTNHDLSPVTSTVSLTETTTEERRWDISSSIAFGVTTSITTGIPGIVDGNIQISAGMTFTFSGGKTWTEEISHSSSPYHQTTAARTTWTFPSPHASSEPMNTERPDHLPSLEIITESKLEILRLRWKHADLSSLSSVNPDPEDDVAKIRPIVSVSIIRRVLPPTPFRQEIPVNSTLPEFSNTGKLHWVRWNGSPPNGAVSVYIKYVDRIDYICKVGCHSDPPKTLKTSTARNLSLMNVTKTVSLTETTTDERRWDSSNSFTVGIRTSIKTGIPFVAEGQIEVNAETTHSFSRGNSWTEQISHSFTLELTVPPNHSCTVKMVGYRYNMDIPFTARLQRTYEDGETKSLTISGNYHGVQVGDIEAEVEKCKPLSNSKRFILQQNDRWFGGMVTRMVTECCSSFIKVSPLEL
ncbi:hypothetical protein CCH79_00016246 [Gambusia affinis]|uniref:Uncharacterized protein n=1 Tax=Gambusia affinis TaxID=33528 RepID=A0A315VMD3_GAMAF|nr:hypothetical protein CCH79_00016246 [Gambusia affinis]